MTRYAARVTWAVTELGQPAGGECGHRHASRNAASSCMLRKMRAIALTYMKRSPVFMPLELRGEVVIVPRQH